ncbi:MAG: hypothetical protein HC835_08640 [Oscillatoriales cyanobacterium RM2_1_1]|nr:hypothetical protein [Oscillatoriales cyanobacterium SM2_3_0]NJO45686.1 hypothetical protein [Oscillatoriales cyanobacterium RM2_1_1]
MNQSKLSQVNLLSASVENPDPIRIEAESLTLTNYRMNLVHSPLMVH